jgi:hypothetical protein
MRVGRQDRKNPRKAAWCIGAMLCTGLRATPALAQEGEDGVPAIEFHGFASQGFILTLQNEYLADDSTDGSFEFSEIGFNFTKELTKTLSTGGQLFAQDLGRAGNLKPQIDWFYLDYRPKDWLGFRAGRLKIPYGLYNEIQDVDSARVPVLLPQSVYPLQARELLFAVTGGEVYGFLRMGGFGALDYRLYGGTIFLDGDELTPPGAGFELDFRVRYVAGGRLFWETPLQGLRVGSSYERVRFDTTAFVPGLEPSLVIENRSWLWLASAEYVSGDFLLSVEYGRSGALQESNYPELSPALDEKDERAYVMASQRVASWFQPGGYVSLLFPNVENREGRENRQLDVALTLRFDVNQFWLVKAEGHFMYGTAGILNPLRINPPDITRADEYWAAYFLKTTAHF